MSNGTLPNRGKVGGIPEYSKIVDIDQVYASFTQANIRNKVIN